MILEKPPGPSGRPTLLLRFAFCMIYRMAKRLIGVLPDGVRMFDRLTGPELLAYTGLLRGMQPAVIDQRAKELLDVFGLAGAGRTLVVDYSAGGLRLDGTFGLLKRDAVQVELITGIRISAKVAWSLGAQTGVVFAEPLSSAHPVLAELARRAATLVVA